MTVTLSRLASPFVTTDLPLITKEPRGGKTNRKLHCLPSLEQLVHQLPTSNASSTDEHVDAKELFEGEPDTAPISIELAGQLSVVRWLFSYGIETEWRVGVDPEPVLFGMVGGELPIAVPKSYAFAIERCREDAGNRPILLEEPWHGEMFFILREWIENSTSIVPDLEKNIAWEMLLAEKELLNEARDLVTGMDSVLEVFRRCEDMAKTREQKYSQCEDIRLRLRGLKHTISRYLSECQILPTPTTVRYALYRLGRSNDAVYEVGRDRNTPVVTDWEGSRLCPTCAIQVVSALIAVPFIRYVHGEPAVRDSRFQVMQYRMGASTWSQNNDHSIDTRLIDHRTWLLEQIAPVFTTPEFGKSRRQGHILEDDKRRYNGREPRTRRCKASLKDLEVCLQMADREEARRTFIKNDIQRRLNDDPYLSYEQAENRSKAYWYDNAK